MKSLSQRGTCTVILTAASFAIARYGNNLSVHQQMNGYVIYTHTCIEILYHIKEKIPALCDNIDKHREHYNLTYMKNQKNCIQGLPW